MFKNYREPANYNTNSKMKRKCGEIFYNNDVLYMIVCTICDMKLFSFSDFVLHISNAHGPEDCVKKETIDKRSESTKYIDYDVADNSNDFIDTKLAVAVKLPLRVCDLKNKKSAGGVCDNGDYSSNESVPAEIIEVLSGTETNVESTNVNKTKSLPVKDYKCTYCTRAYTTERYLKIHIKDIHLAPKQFKCEQCTEAFGNERFLELHRCKVHNGFVCALCHKVYKTNELLRRHMPTHASTRNFKCDVENCNKAFYSQNNLARHKYTHIREPKYICELCGYSCRYRDALTVHLRSHTGEKPYECATCKRSFASKSLLSEHQAMHSTDRPYKCDSCNATFARPKALYHHKHLHLGVKKFVCKVCGKAYAQAAGLSAHVRAHKAQGIARIELQPKQESLTSVLNSTNMICT